jgi:GTP cyclohydrolase II
MRQLGGGAGALTKEAHEPIHSLLVLKGDVRVGSRVKSRLHEEARGKDLLHSDLGEILALSLLHKGMRGGEGVVEDVMKGDRVLISVDELAAVAIVCVATRE